MQGAVEETASVFLWLRCETQVAGVGENVRHLPSVIGDLDDVSAYDIFDKLR